jgi:hypothetical protein
MSGGHFDYNQYRIQDIIEELERLIKTNDSNELDDWGGTVGRHYSNKTIAEFRIGCEYLKKAQIYAQRIDWLVSGDDGEESFHERLAEELRKFNKQYFMSGTVV